MWGAATTAPPDAPGAQDAVREAAMGRTSPGRGRRCRRRHWPPPCPQWPHGSGCGDETEPLPLPVRDGTLDTCSEALPPRRTECARSGAGTGRAAVGPPSCCELRVRAEAARPGWGHEQRSQSRRGDSFLCPHTHTQHIGRCLSQTCSLRCEHSKVLCSFLWPVQAQAVSSVRCVCLARQR